MGTRASTSRLAEPVRHIREQRVNARVLKGAGTVVSLLEARTAPPLPPKASLTQAALEGLLAPGLHVVHAPTGWVVSENVAAVLASAGAQVAWIRVSRLDAHPTRLTEALAVVNQAASVVVESCDRPDAVAPSLELARGLARSVDDSGVILLAHSTLPKRLVPHHAHIVGRRELAFDADAGRELLAIAAECLGFPAVVRLLKLARGRAAIVRDIIDAAQARDQDTVRHAIESCHRRAKLASVTTHLLLGTCTDAELEALAIANALQYWNPMLSPNVEGSQLRPWLIPLPGGWFWLRPAWRDALNGALRRIWRANPQLEFATENADVATPPRTGLASAAEPQPAPKPSLPKNAPPGDETPPEEDTWEKSVASARPILAARLLGTFDLSIEGRSIEALSGRLGPMILKYLLARPGYAAPRDILMETFWPDVDPKLASNRLHVAVSTLRRGLRAVTKTPVVKHADQTYRINPDFDITLDAVDFEQAVDKGTALEAEDATETAISQYMRAVAIYRGDFLAETPYDEWTLLPREAYRSRYLDALDRLSLLLEADGRLAECIPIAQLTLRQDPCSESAHRLLMRSFAAIGQHSQAIRQYEICRRVLNRSLGTEPSQETVRQLRQIGSSPESADPISGR